MASGSKWLVRVLCCSLLLLVVRPAQAAPSITVSDPVGLDTPRQTFPGAGYGAVAASNGSTWLVAYRDAYLAKTVSARIFDAEGVGAERAFDLRIAAVDADHVQVVFDGIDFIVAWMETVADGSARALFYARVDAQGTVLTPATQLDSIQYEGAARIAGGDAGAFALVCDASGFCRSWLIGHSSAPAKGDDLALTGVPYRLSLAFSDGVWLAIFDGLPAQMAQFAGDGSLIDGTVGAFADLEQLSSLASDDNGFVAALSLGNQVRFVRVGFDGQVTPAGSASAPEADSLFYVRLAATPDGYVLVWAEYPGECSNCWFKRRFQVLTKALEPTGTEHVELLPIYPTEELAISPDGKDGLYLSLGSLRALHFGQTITVAASQDIGQRSTVVDDVRAAPAPNGWLVAWHETDPVAQRVQAQLVDAAGTPSGAPFLIDEHASEFFQTGLGALSRGEDGWLVAVSVDGQSKISHISDAQEVTERCWLNAQRGSVSLASSRDGWLALWTELASSQYVVHARRFEAGASTWTDFALGNSRVTSQAVGADSGYLVAWVGDDNNALYAEIPSKGDAATPVPQPVPNANHASSLLLARPDNQSLFFAWSKGGDMGTSWLLDGQVQSLAYHAPLCLVSVDGMAVLGIREPGFPPKPLLLAGTTPGTELQVLGSAVPNNWTWFSESAGNTFLVTFVEPVRWHASWSGRPAWQVVQVESDLPTIEAGGAGGVSGAGGAGGVSGAGGADGVSGAGSAGAASNTGGAFGEGGGGLEPTSGGVGGAAEPTANMAGAAHGGSPGEDPIASEAGDSSTFFPNGGDTSGSKGGAASIESSRLRTSSACGCRVLGRPSRGDPQGCWLALSLLAATLRRRRSTNPARRT